MRHKRRTIQEREVQGLKYLKAISGLLERRHDVGCQRDRADNRLLHMDQYVSLLLLYMFNPICTSLRSLQQVSELKNGQRKLGVARASLGSLSEAAMIEIIAELGAQLQPIAATTSSRTFPGFTRRSKSPLPDAPGPSTMVRKTFAMWLVKRWMHERVCRGLRGQ
jgi:hypothetical protein